ncbi:unnamed protein product [Mytilus coruscus]|uniref:Uncharacterized protein n=1 Tax=Mytilus coruscus TaxID=42192 RepID=A0A6J8DI94_MYTCO|nr:unnamed protein product [Mytilus coruscus]
MKAKIDGTNEGEVLLQQWKHIRKGTKNEYITFYKEVSQAVSEATKNKDSGSKSSDETLYIDEDSKSSSSSPLNRIAYNNDFCASSHDLSSDSTDLHSSDSISLSRPDKLIFDEALNTEAKWAGCKPNEPLILPTKLRPKKQANQNNNRKVSKIYDKLNEKSMVKNPLFLKNVNDMLGHDQFIDVETDTSYNNRPQAGGKAGTQSFTPTLQRS